MWWLIILLAALLLLLGVILVRTLRFTPPAERIPEAQPVSVDGKKATEHLAAMIRCQTVSSRDKSQEDGAEFEKFRQLLPKLYPRIHETCECEHIGRHGLLFRWPGRQESAPTVLMAHYDVVAPGDLSAWEKPPFDGVVADGCLWGRGTLDTKGTLCGILEAAETLISEGFAPQHDIYFSFAGDEEIMGDGAPQIVDVLEARHIRPALVVDEGGAVVEHVFPGVSKPCALIGIGEKGQLEAEFSLQSQGGHASSPPPHTPVGVLAQAVTAVEGRPFPMKLTPPAAEMFDTLGRHSTFVYRMIFANLWLFRPVLDALCKKQGGEMNALMRTTCAFTMMEGSRQSNVIPPQAKVGANLRLIGGDTMESALRYLRAAVRNPDIEITAVQGMNPSPYSDTKGEGWQRLKTAIGQSWPEAIVSPYLMIACSDSRHFCRISDAVMRFSAMALSGEERALIHGNNERIPVQKIADTVAFYIRLIRLS